MTKLSVNVNKVALLRNTRVHGIPSVTGASRTAIEAGAYGITVHPRPDQRHITPGDVDDLAEMLKDHPGIEYNIEGNPFHQVMDIVRKTWPTQATLVPDDPDAFTSDHGWDVKANAERLKPIIAELKDLGCRVSLFMDAEPDQIDRVPDIGADRIELYTEPYAVAFAAGPEQMRPVLSALRRSGRPCPGDRPGRQRRARPEPGQPGDFLRYRARRTRGLHRPRADRRRAGHGFEKRRGGLPGRTCKSGNDFHQYVSTWNPYDANPSKPQNEFPMEVVA